MRLSSRRAPAQAHVAEAQPQLDFVETERMNVYILQVMSILRQAYCSPKYLYYLLPARRRRFAKRGLPPQRDLRLGMLSSRSSGTRRSTRSAGHRPASPPSGIRSHLLRSTCHTSRSFRSSRRCRSRRQRCRPDHQLDAQRKIRHWYWASVFTNRYSGSVESTAARDYLDVTSWFKDDMEEPAVLDELRQRFVALELRREVRRGTSVYNGIFNLLVLRGAATG